jgi:hypothetical protein
VLQDCTKQDVEKAIGEIKNEFVTANTNDRDKIFLFVYYAGYGEMKNGMTEIVFNSKEGPNFEIEAKLTALA